MKVCEYLWTAVINVDFDGEVESVGSFKRPIIELPLAGDTFEFKCEGRRVNGPKFLELVKRHWDYRNGIIYLLCIIPSVKKAN